MALTNKKDDEKQTSDLWIAVGVGLGCTLGLVLNNVAVGIAIGIAVGFAIAASKTKHLNN